MTRERLYIINGWGPDSVGLVDALTTPLGRARANVVDLRQDVLHGLFTIHMVVDLADTELRLEELESLVAHLAEDTGLVLTAQKYHPAAAVKRSENLLVVLLGRDRPGIVATASEVLGRYRANIERVESISREGMFLMELLTDTSQCRIPLTNLMASLKDAMAALDMQTLFQAQDVFNKQKRVILFDLRFSLFDAVVRQELRRQLGPDHAANARAPAASGSGSLRDTLNRLEGLPASVLGTLVDGVSPTRGTFELVQVLRTLGYRVALSAPVLRHLVDHLHERLALDHGFGVPVQIDDDTQTLTGVVSDDDMLAIQPERVVRELVERERVPRADITVISDQSGQGPVGMRAELDLGLMLHLRQERILSHQQMAALLDAFGLADSERPSGRPS